MKKFLTLSLAAILLIFSAIPAAAVESQTDSPAISPSRASYQLDQYTVGLSNVSSGKMEVTFIVVGTHSNMTAIGAKKIVVEKLVSGSWTEHKTFTGRYGYGCYYYGDSLAFSVTSGTSYRATLTAYAKDSDGSDTGTVTSGTLRAI